MAKTHCKPTFQTKLNVLNYLLKHKERFDKQPLTTTLAEVNDKLDIRGGVANKKLTMTYSSFLMLAESEYHGKKPLIAKSAPQKHRGQIKNMIQMEEQVKILRNQVRCLATVAEWLSEQVGKTIQARPEGVRNILEAARRW